MARSTHVYVVTNPAQEPARGFTVKHEMLSFLKRIGEEGRHGRSIFRLVDAGWDDTASVTSWVAEEYFQKEWQ